MFNVPTLILCVRICGYNVCYRSILINSYLLIIIDSVFLSIEEQFYQPKSEMYFININRLSIVVEPRERCQEIMT